MLQFSHHYQYSRKPLVLTCLSKLDGLQVSCHHVHRCQQGFSSFSNSQLTSKELLLDEPQSSMSTNGRDSIQDPVPWKEKYYISILSVVCFLMAFL